MNKSQRIYFSTGTTGNAGNAALDKTFQVKLEQDIDSLEFLSLKIGTADVYQNFNSDYGVLFGRVLANGGIGIPNVRISIFIPLTDEDANNKEIYSIYPYKTPRDKNNEGKRYNLLPRVAKRDPVTGIITPKQPFGSFPIKEEIVGNLPFLDVYKKYYKYTALTNNSGDYMIFGVPIGTQTVHMSADITDIGKYSMNAASMVTNLGYSPALFTDGGNKIKESSDLGDLPNIETQEISVDVRPFWGDVENFEIGITRQDFRIRSVLKNTFTIFGSVFTDETDMQWGTTRDPDKNRPHLLFYHDGGDDGVGIKSKRVGKVTETIYYYPASVSDAEINSGNSDGQLLVMDSSEYSVYKNGGDFVVIINCNRDKVTIAEDGTETPVPESFQGGLYTSFRGFMTLEISPEDLNLNWSQSGDHLKMKPIREILKFPQMATMSWNCRNNSTNNWRDCWTSSFRYDNNACAAKDNLAWRNQHYRFCGGCYYSVAKFNGLVFNNKDEKQDVHRGWFDCDHINLGCHNSVPYNVGAIVTNDSTSVTGNTVMEMPYNITTSGGKQVFGANWLNIGVYLPQTNFVYDNYSYNEDRPRSNSHMAVDFSEAPPNKQTYYFTDNLQKIGGTSVNTCSFARSDYHWTDFIEVPKEDILAMNDYECKGIKTSTDGVSIPGSSYNLKGKYRSGCIVPSGDPITWSVP